MKILNSNIMFSSDNSFNQMDLSLEEKSEQRSVRMINGNLNRQTLNGDSSDIPQIIVDRISISQKEKYEYQSNYSATLSGKSSVKSIETGDITEHENQYAIEKLIGGVIDKKVVINHIERKEDITISDSENTLSKTPKPQEQAQTNQNIQTQMFASQSYEMKLMQTDIHFEEENVLFASTGEVTTEDGRVINFSLDMSLDRSFLSRREQETVVKRWQEKVNLTDPLVISLDGKTPELSDTIFEFDLDSDGKMENINFTSQGSGFLAFDKNNDNLINSGSELFGPGSGNGFEELAAYDEDQNGWIDENDSVFSKLSVWTKDKNGKDSLISLKDAGVGAIALANAATQLNMTDSDNNLDGQLKSSGVFLFEDGNIGSVHQIDLADKTQELLDKEKAQLAIQKQKELEKLREDDLRANANTQQVNSAQFSANQQQLGETPNPLQELIDRINELKEEMERLFGKMSPTSGYNSSYGSRPKHYSDMKFDPTSLLFGDNKGPIRSY